MEPQKFTSAKIQRQKRGMIKLHEKIVGSSNMRVTQQLETARAVVRQSFEKIAGASTRSVIRELLKLFDTVVPRHIAKVSNLRSYCR